MDKFDGNAIVYYQDAFNTTNGKTAHGLVRYTESYRVVGVIDSRYADRDSGEVLDNRRNNIPIFGSLAETLAKLKSVTHFIIGLTPDGGRLNAQAKEAVISAINAGLNVDCGLHDILSDDETIASLAREKGVTIRDVRKPPPLSRLHFFTGKVEEVGSLKVAVLGTDSAVGKRTTAWLIVNELRRRGHSAELIGTGQTAWLQGARYSIMLDSLVNDFVTGEIEHAIWSAWHDLKPAVIVLEGQGSLLNPAYPDGFELITAGRPDVIVLQHAPARTHYDGFPQYQLHPLAKQLRAVEEISDKPVIAISINHEGIPIDKIAEICLKISQQTNRLVFDPLRDGVGRLADLLEQDIKK
ncbi:MAG: DUF1611 domain-containing protein [Patescibacteria group bacterium]